MSFCSRNMMHEIFTKHGTETSVPRKKKIFFFFYLAHNILYRNNTKFTTCCLSVALGSAKHVITAKDFIFFAPIFNARTEAELMMPVVGRGYRIWEQKGKGKKGLTIRSIDIPPDATVASMVLSIASRRCRRCRQLVCSVWLFSVPLHFFIAFVVFFRFVSASANEWHVACLRCPTVCQPVCTAMDEERTKSDICSAFIRCVCTSWRCDW